MIKQLEKNPYISYTITILIALTIFYFSSLNSQQTGSAGSSIKPIVYHISIFFLLSLFLLISLVKGKNKKFILPVIIISLLYAVSDEIHQSFVSGRSSSFADLGLDSIGIFLGFLLYSISLRYRKIRKDSSSDLLKHSEKVAKKLWDNKEDEVWNNV